MNAPSLGDARFFSRSGPHSLATVAAVAHGVVVASDRLYSGIAALSVAGPDDVSFFDNRRYAAALADTRAGAVIVHPTMTGQVPASAVPIASAAIQEAWARVAALFHPPPRAVPGIHPLSDVAASASIHPSARVEAFVRIGERAEIGPGCHVEAHASIGAGVVLGRDCRIGSHASVSHALLGERVCLHPGVRIGQEGFGFAPTAEGFLTIPQLGRVVIEDDVEVGANSTIDRGSAQDTVIGAGSRLDNLVQIGHNVRIGRCCVIVAQAGIAGSTVLEDFVQVGGQAAVAGHLRIGSGARIGAQSGIMADVPAHAVLIGTPAQPKLQFFRQVAILRRMTRGQATV